MTSGRNSLEVTLYPAVAGTGEQYPGISFEAFDPDWSHYNTLRFDAFNPAPDTIPLALRIDDHSFPDFPDRYNKTFRLAPGASHIAVPLDSLITSGSRRQLRLDAIGRVFLFVAEPKEPLTLYLDDIRLE